MFSTNRMPEPVAALTGENLTAIAEVLRSCGLEPTIDPESAGIAPFAS